MVQLIHREEYQQMPWKNKKGFTSQILIQPENASLDQLDFIYRLSSAMIKEDSSFSQFSGYQRILLPVKGKGFVLDGAEYELFEVARFSGDKDTHCELIKGDVLDLGLIYDPKRVQVQIKILEFKDELNFQLDQNSQNIIYILQGSVNISNLLGHELDTFFISKESSIELGAIKKTKIAYFQLNSNA